MSLTVAAPSMATPPPATLRRLVPTVTWKSPGAGTERPSRVSSKVRVSVFPFTSAPTNAGGAVLFVTAWSGKVATGAPPASRNGFAPLV